jgi:protein TonB
VAIATPAPRYPASALRRGESGEVLLRIEVDANGMPYAMDIMRSSGSLELDRAALVAARDWRFRPALRDGQPVSASVNVPITFDSRR